MKHILGLSYIRAVVNQSATITKTKNCTKLSFYTALPDAVSKNKYAGTNARKKKHNVM